MVYMSFRPARATHRNFVSKNLKKNLKVILIIKMKLKNKKKKERQGLSILG